MGYLSLNVLSAKWVDFPLKQCEVPISIFCQMPADLPSFDKRCLCNDRLQITFIFLVQFILRIILRLMF